MTTPATQGGGRSTVAAQGRGGTRQARGGRTAASQASGSTSVTPDLGKVQMQDPGEGCSTQGSGVEDK